MTSLTIAADFVLPPDADARRISVLGMSGSGKTSAAKVIVEALARAGRRVCVLDPAGVWWGLRTSADGERAALPFVVFGGRHADVPLEAGAGAAVADVVMQDEVPVVLDLSGFEDEDDLSRCAADFLRRLAFLQNPDREPLLVVADEADLIAPQNARGLQVDSQRQLIRIARRSRSDGLGLLTITQRPAAIHKDVLAQAEAVLLMRFGGYSDLATVEAWIGSYLSRAERDQVISALPRLDDGECFLTSPSWMRTFTRLHLPLPATFDSSATPRAGERRVARASAGVDLTALAERFAAAIRAEQDNDPEALRRRIDGLTRQLAARPVETRSVVERVEVPVFREGETERLAALADDMAALGKDLLSEAQAIQRELRAAQAAPPLITHPAPEEVGPEEVSEDAEAADVSADVPEDADAAPVEDDAAECPVPGGASGRAALAAAHRRVLDALADFAALGTHRPLREHAAIFAGMSPTSGSFKAHLTFLRQAGLLEYPVPGRLELTGEGRAAARVSDRPLTRAQLHEAWLRRLPDARRRILRAAISAFPQPLDRLSLADAVGMSPTSGSYKGHLTELKALGLLVFPRPGHVKASALLFPEGLP